MTFVWHLSHKGVRLVSLNCTQEMDLIIFKCIDILLLNKWWIKIVLGVFKRHQLEFTVTTINHDT